jgi:PAS domain S-box-containing protein
MNTDRSIASTEFGMFPLADFELNGCAECRISAAHRLRYQELFEFALDCHLVTNSAGIILEANHAAAALFKCPKEFLIDKPLGLLVRDGSRSRFYECLAKLRRAGGPDEFETRMGRGEYVRDVEVRATSAGTPAVGRATFHWLIRDITERRRAESARTELLRQLVSAQENERRRLSREIHDWLGQELTGLTLGLKVLAADIPPDTGASRRLAELRETIDRIGREAHDVALDLRPTALDDLGLRAALDTLIGRWSERAGVTAQFHFDAPGTGRFPSEVESAVYRVVQEALTNVAKHARAARVSIIVEHRDQQLVAIVEDDGCGFEPEAIGGNGRLGLSGMNERVTLVDGTFQVESSSGAGTTVRARIACEEAVEATRK